MTHPTDADRKEAIRVSNAIADKCAEPGSFDGFRAAEIIAQVIASARAESAMQQISNIGQLQTALEERGAARKDAQDLATAARDYFDGYMQDEAASREDCISDDQHIKAVKLRVVLVGIEHRRKGEG